MSLRIARLLQLFGILIAVVGLAGFWLYRDVERTVLSEAAVELINPEREAFQASFVVAGRDKLVLQNAGDPIYNAQGRIVGRTRPAITAPDGINTDAVFFVNIVGNTVTVINIPRDTYLPEYGRRLVGIYARGGNDRAGYLKQAVSELLNIPIDYYAVINLEIFRDAIDAVDGVHVNVPERMYHVDHAGGLYIDLQPGPQILDGDAAEGFVRYRGSAGDDLNRIDNLKTLMYAFLSRLRELNVRAVGTLPQLIESYSERVETNASPTLARQLLPRLANLEVRAFTLPTFEREGSGALHTDPDEVELFLAQVFGGTAREEIVEVPEARLLISNHSGVSELGEKLKRKLIAIGVDEEQLIVYEGDAEPTPSQLRSEREQLSAVAYYASLLGVDWAQVHRLNPSGAQGEDVELELILGEDAKERFFAFTEPDELILAGAQRENTISPVEP